MGEMALNISSLTEVEFLEHFPVISIPETLACHEWDQSMEAPANWDWREAMVVSKVQNQGAMGSSVPFTVADQISSAHAIETKTELIELSAKQIADCYKPIFLDDTFGYTVENGLESNQS